MRQPTKQLTDNEQSTRDKSLKDYFFGWTYDADDERTYHAGFVSGLSHNQAKLDKLISYIKGEITRSEIEEILNA